jgi:hypothetical protein
MCKGGGYLKMFRPAHHPFFLMNYPAASCEVSNISPPLTGGDEGEGEMKHKITLSLTLPPQGGGNNWETPKLSFEEFF